MPRIAPHRPGLDVLEPRQLLSALPLDAGAGIQTQQNSDGTAETTIRLSEAVSPGDTGRKARRGGGVGLTGVDVSGRTIGSTAGGAASSFDDRDWVVIRGVDFGGGVDGITLNLSANSQNGNERVQLRVGSPNGLFVGSVTPTATGTGIFRDFDVRLGNDVRGVHDLYLIAAGGNDVAVLNTLTLHTDGVAGNTRLAGANRSPSPGVDPRAAASASGDLLLEAVDLDASGNTADASTTGTVSNDLETLGDFDAGDYAMFEGVKLDPGDGIGTVLLEFDDLGNANVPPGSAVAEPLGVFELRSGAASGDGSTLLGTFSTQNRDTNTQRMRQTLELDTPITGEQDLFLVATEDAEVRVRSLRMYTAPDATSLSAEGITRHSGSLTLTKGSGVIGGLTDGASFKIENVGFGAPGEGLGGVTVDFAQGGLNSSSNNSIGPGLLLVYLGGPNASDQPIAVVEAPAAGETSSRVDLPREFNGRQDLIFKVKGGLPDITGIRFETYAATQNDAFLTARDLDDHSFTEIYSANDQILNWSEPDRLVFEEINLPAGDADQITLSLSNINTDGYHRFYIFVTHQGSSTQTVYTADWTQATQAQTIDLNAPVRDGDRVVFLFESNAPNVLRFVSAALT